MNNKLKASFKQLFDHADLLTMDGFKVCGVEGQGMMNQEETILKFNAPWSACIFQIPMNQEIEVIDGEFSLADRHGTMHTFEVYSLMKTSRISLALRPLFAMATEKATQHEGAPI